MSLKSFVSIVSVLTLFFCMAPAFAAENTPAVQKDSQVTDKTAKVEKADSWHFAVIPAVAMMGIKGTIGANYDTAKMDLSPSALSDATRSSAGLAAGAFKGNHAIHFSASYLKLNDTSTLPVGSTLAVADTTLETTQVELTYGYRFYRKPRLLMGAFGGVRYWNVSGTIETTPYVPGNASRNSQRADWFDPIIGLEVRPLFTKKLSLPMVVDAGGFGIGSEFTSKGRVGLSYMFHPRVSAELGYTYTYVNYRQRGTVYDVTWYGPYVAMALLF